jgi:hypothetical protein
MAPRTGVRPARASKATRRPLATPAEVAGYLRKEEKTLANWRSEGIGPRWCKVGHDVLYDWADIDEWVESGKSGRPAA